MSIKTLYKSGALGNGADLWILPELSLCSWAKKIDWYINLQLSKAQLHRPRKISENIQTILKNNDWDEPPVPILEGASLMVACAGHLPSQQIIRVAHQPHMGSEDPLKSWIRQIDIVWNQLSYPTLRVFLPDQYSARDFSAKWKEKSSKQTVTIVPPAGELDS